MVFTVCSSALWMKRHQMRVSSSWRIVRCKDALVIIISIKAKVLHFMWAFLHVGLAGFCFCCFFKGVYDQDVAYSL